jgi:hypothetical protein
MSRDLSNLNIEQTFSKIVVPVLFFYADFPSGTSHAWSGIGDFQWDDQTWLGVGDFGGVSEISESLRLESVGAQFQLSGIPSGLINIAINDNIQGRDCKLYLGFLNNVDLTLIDDPFLLFSGFLDTMTISEGANSAVIRVNAENKLRELNRSRPRRLTDQDQKAEFPEDKGLEYVSALQGADIYWGRPYER